LTLQETSTPSPTTPKPIPHVSSSPKDARSPLSLALMRVLLLEAELLDEGEGKRREKGVGMGNGG